MIQSLNPALLQYSWTADVRLKNDKIISIWHTAWHSTKNEIAEIVSISTDLPRYKIK
jgi:hypothetical protein